MLLSRRSVGRRCLEQLGNTHCIRGHTGLKLSPRLSLYIQKHQRDFSRNLSLYRWYEAHSRSPKDNQHNRLHAQYFRDGNHLIYRYLSRHGWRLSTSWGKFGDGQRISDNLRDNKFDENGSNDSSNLHTRKQQKLKLEYEDFKKQIEADPFGMLFGWGNLRRCHPRDKSAGKNHDIFADRDKEVPKAEVRQQTKEPFSRPKPTDIRENQSGGVASGPSSHTKDPEHFAGQNEQKEEFEFDPITMRKVPKKRRPTISAFEGDGSSFCFSIPVKKYESSTSPGATGLTSHEATKDLPNDQDSKSSRQDVVSNSTPERSSWLVQEGFNVGNCGSETSQQSLRPKKQAENQSRGTSKIETALDRHLAAQRKISDNNKAGCPGLSHADAKNMTEEIDQLRPSDVRASSGLKNRLSKEALYEKSGGQQYSEDNLKNLIHTSGAPCKEDFASRRASPSNLKFELRLDKSASDVYSLPNTSKHSYENKIHKSDPNPPDVGISKQKPALQTVQALCHPKTDRPTQDAADRAHQEEIKTQKAVMEDIEMRSIDDLCFNKKSAHFAQESGEGDMAANVHKFFGRDHWYKQKAPHAAQTTQRLEQGGIDTALVREIKSIYEDQYGIIDSSHRQPSEPAIQDSEQPNQNLKAKDLSSPYSNQLSNESRLNISDFPGIPDKPKNPQAHKQNTEDFGVLKAAQLFFGDKSAIQRLLHEINTEAVGRKSVRPVPAQLLNSSNPYEQSLVHTFNGAWDLFKIGAELANIIKFRNNEKQTPTASLESEEGGISKMSSPVPPAKEASNLISSASYKILAYDSSMQKVLATNVNSPANPIYEKPVSIVEALSGLTNPAPFLRHFASLQNAGYELVFGSSTMLIFKKLKQEEVTPWLFDEPPQSTVENYPLHTNPIDGTTTQTGNFASPTGFVNHDSILPPFDFQNQQVTPSYGWNSNASDKIRREEPVFSGSRNGWQEHQPESKSAGSKARHKHRRMAMRRRSLKRMFWVGTFVAGCCYAAGVTFEALRP